jgi:hypothetical protein
MWSLTERMAEITRMTREGQETRDREGWKTSPAEADAYRRIVIEQDFTGIIRGWTREAAQVGAPTRRITGEHTPGGQQGRKPETVNRIENGRMIGERPGQGGSGRYGTRKQQITRGPSPKQQAWIDSMVAELAGDDLAAAQQGLQALAAKTGGALTGGYGGSASKAIDLLKIVTKAARERSRTATVTRTRTELPTVPDGRYAVEADDGTLRFYKVKNHKPSGRVYLDVQASDDMHRVPWRAYPAILAKIAADPQAAGHRYGQEIGSCWKCGRTLTDKESRDLGEGPWCRNK